MLERVDRCLAKNFGTKVTCRMSCNVMSGQQKDS